VVDFHLCFVRAEGLALGIDGALRRAPLGLKAKTH
jgi:hypothetical protein